MASPSSAPPSSAAPSRAPGRWLDDPGLRTPTAIVGVALLARLTWAAWIPIEPLSDGGMYHLFAQRIAAGLGYVGGDGAPTAYFAVGPSFVYSLAFRSGLPALPLIAFVQALVGAATVAGVMAVARRWLDPRPAWLAGALLALWPSQIQFTTVLASELWFSAVVVLAWFLWERPRDAAFRRGVSVGIALGAAAYLRPVALLLLVPWSLARAVQTRDVRGTLLAAAIAAASMALVIAPWSLRNTRAFGEFVMISTNGGPNLWMGNHPGTDGRYMPLPEEALSLDELERDAELGGRARAFILDEPGAFVVRTLSKFVRLHDRETIGVHWNGAALADRIGDAGLTLLKVISTVYWWMALAAALLGLGAWLRLHAWRGVFHAVTLTWLYFAAIHAVIVIQDRYHFPVIPSVAMLAGFGLAQLARRAGSEPAQGARASDPAGPAEAHL